jgi:hypothetical protein
VKIITEKNTIGLDFVPETESPVVLFDSFSKMFNSIIDINIELIKKIDPLIDVKFLLVDISRGSIYTNYIKQIIIPEKDDNVIAYPEEKGNILDYTRFSQGRIIDTLSDADEQIIKNENINEIHGKIVEYSHVTGVNENPNFKPPNKLIIAGAIDLMGKSTTMLAVSDKFYFQDNYGRKELRKVYTDIDYDEIKREMAKRITETPIQLKLKIKTADFLGKSRWKFKLDNNHTIEAKILDEKWLAAFHAQIINIGPGDSIEISGILKETFDDFGKCIDTQYIINEVIKVHKSEEQNEFEY